MPEELNYISTKDALGRELMSKDNSASGGVADINCTAASGLHFLSLYWNGILEVQPKELASGLHIASLYFDGVQVGTVKVNVIR